MVANQYGSQGNTFNLNVLKNHTAFTTKCIFESLAEWQIWLQYTGLQASTSSIISCGHKERRMGISFFFLYREVSWTTQITLTQLFYTTFRVPWYADMQIKTCMYLRNF